MQHYSDELKAKILTEFKQKQSVTTLSKQYMRIVRYKSVKGFQSLAACQHLLYRPVSVRQSFHLAQFFFHLLCLSFCNGNSFPNTSK